MEKTILLDANCIIVRSIMANAKSDLKSGGMFTGGIYFATNTLASIIETVQAQGHHVKQVVACFDDGVPKYRSTRLKNYKGDRKKKREMLDPEEHAAAMRQLPQTRRLWSAMGITCLSNPETEADDLVYGYARLINKSGGSSVVCSTDKDVLQCAGDISGCRVLDPYTGRIVAYQNFHKVTGVDPRYYVLYRAMTGDTSDSLPGLKGVGEKTALELIAKAQPYVDLGPVKQWHEVHDYIQSLPRVNKWVLGACTRTARREIQRVIIGIGLRYGVRRIGALPAMDSLSNRYNHKKVKELLDRYEIRSFTTEKASVLFTIREAAKKFTNSGKVA